jgi:hypothetical protein
LFLMSPLIAEFLLGNLPITLLPALLLLAPMYGGAAVLIREVVRGRGRGWPSILGTALAYGLVEEGLVTESLFNPEYAPSASSRRPSPSWRRRATRGRRPSDLPAGGARA